MSKTIEVTTLEQFKTIIFENSNVVLDFWAPWCAPCKQLMPVFEKVSEKFNDVVFCKINIQDAVEISELLGIRSIPTLKFVKNGEELISSAGFMPEPVLTKNVESTFGVKQI